MTGPSVVETTEPLLQLGAAQLAAEIARGSVSARDALEAYARRIAEVQPQINALVVSLLDEARRAAADADERQARGEPLPLLHGVPMTIKECFYQAGTTSTLGLSRLKEDRVSEDGPLVARLRQAGAVFLGKTNVPQLMLFHETDNPLYGRTCNPCRLDRSPGGSSGGEAAMIAARGSALGLASDLGGSIRVPAHFCGIQGLKPTSGRLTQAGMRDNLRGFQAIRLQAGPLARRVEDLELAMRVLSSEHPSTPGDSPAPWRSSTEIDVSSLRVGVWTSDPLFPPAPAIARAVNESAKVLEGLGAELVPFQVPDMVEMVDLYYGLIGADGGRDALRLLVGSERDPQLKMLTRIALVPWGCRTPLAILLDLMGQRRSARMLRAARPASADRYWQLAYRAEQARRQFSERLASERLDAVIAPPHALPAFPNGKAYWLLEAACYCFYTNLLEVPSGVVTVTRVQEQESGGGAPGRDRVDREAWLANQDSSQLPVGVQVFAPHWREDTVLAIMRALEAE